jgi:hypothetical protein
VRRVLFVLGLSELEEREKMHKYYEPTAIPEQQETVTPPVLGSWHVVSAQAIKCHGNDENTVWQRQQIEPQRMMFVGVRQVREGMMVDDEKIYHDADGVGVDIDYFRSFHATRFITVWLMIIDGHKNPIHVLPQDAKEVGE